MRPDFFIKKEILTQVFSCEFCEIFKITFFTEHLWTTSSVEQLFKNSVQKTRDINFENNRYD